MSDANRTALPNRRPSFTIRVVHKPGQDGEARFIVRYGFDSNWMLRECFCSSPKSGSDMNAFINDACIAISLLLQHGMTITELVDAFGEDRAEGALAGPPASPLGSIARAGMILEAEVREEK